MTVFDEEIAQARRSERGLLAKLAVALVLTALVALIHVLARP